MGSRSFGSVTAAVFILFVAFALFCAPSPLQAQQPDAQQPGPPRMGQREQKDQLPKDIQDRMAKERLKNRYDSLKQDSEKLLELATELKQYVDKSGENVMSLDVIKKCDEIEKLSKSVRSKMKGN